MSISIQSDLPKMSKPDETVKVVVRIRPMSSEEERNGNLVYVLELILTAFLLKIF